ncbi:MAG: sodium-dependent transporter [Clostridiales bacterium]|nr:sodium-dependent transporter [Clostridiales bacterium]
MGFVLAAAGSAVGLGNIWRFPYLAAKYGGGTFLFLYLLLTVTFGFCLMITEIAIGRKTKKSALYAFSCLNKKFSFLGILASLVPIIIFPYYCVIGGWVTKYFTVYLTGQGGFATDSSFFTGFISKSAEPVLWLAVFIAATAIIVMMGVEKGVEKASKFLMPILVLLSIGIAVYVLTIPGAMDGVLYYIKPDFSRFSFNGLLAAMGQLFYSMSLAMGIMITYGSYVPDSENVESSVRNIELFDTGIAFVAGLIIIPSVFAFSGGDQSVLSSGPSLMFITLPNVFASMKFGNVIGLVFFVLVLFAALTSSISLMETIVSIVQDKFHLKRMTTCLIVLGAAIIIALPSSLGFGIWSGITLLGMCFLDFFDFISNSILMPVVAFFTCVFVGFVIKPSAIVDEVEKSAPFKSKKIYTVLIKYIAPILIVLILLSSIANAFGINTL